MRKKLSSFGKNEGIGKGFSRECCVFGEGIVLVLGEVWWGFGFCVSGSSDSSILYI